MTHDELLAKIDGTCEWINSTPLSLEFQTRLLNQHKALRAVVELHKPEETQAKSVFWCKVCMGHDELDGTYRLFYPCPTIQAIEEQLK